MPAAPFVARVTVEQALHAVHSMLTSCCQLIGHTPNGIATTQRVAASQNDGAVWGIERRRTTVRLDRFVAKRIAVYDASHASELRCHT